MTYDDTYLKRGLERRVNDAIHNVQVAISRMLAEHAKAGALQSGSTLLRLHSIPVDGLTDWFADAATFVFSASDRHDQQVATSLAEAAGQLCALLDAHARERAKNTGMKPEDIGKQADSIAKALDERKQELLDDFLNGMLGSQKMKKDPLVTLNANQTNSPGAIQQVGVHSQQRAQVINYGPLIAAVETICKSDEFNSLTPEQQVEFKDVADVVTDEASKPAPDVNRLKRWAEKLKKSAAELGMRIATSTIGELIARIFV